MPKKKKKGSKKDKSEKCQKEKIDLTNENKEDDILKSKSNFLEIFKNVLTFDF